MQKGGKHILEFRDYEKVDKASNVTLPLVITTTIENHLVLGKLIDN